MLLQFEYRVASIKIFDDMEDKEFSFEDLREAFFRKGKYGILIFSLSIIIGIFYILIKNPVYESEARIRLPGSSSVSEFVLSGITNPWNDVPTQLELIKSRTILSKVVNNLNLRFKPSDKRFYDYVDIEYLRIPEEALEGTYFLSIKQDSLIILNSKKERIASARYGETIYANSLTMKMSPKTSKAIGKTLKFEIKSMNSAIKSLSSNVRVNQEGRSFIAVIKARANSPNLAKNIAEEIALAYYDFTLEDARSQATSLRMFLEEQIKNIEDQLSDFEQEFSRIKKQLGTFGYIALENINESLKDVFQKLNSLEFDRTKLLVEKQKIDHEIKTITEQIEGKGYYKEYAKIASSLDFGGDPKVTALQNRLFDLELKKAALKEKYTDNNPEIIALEKQIEEIKNSLSKTQQEVTAQLVPSTADPIFQQLASKLIQNQVELLTVNTAITAIDSALKEYESKISSLPENAISYNKIKRKYIALSSIYNLLLEKLEQTKIEEASKISDVRITDFPLLPTSPVVPNKIMTILISILLGGILGIFFTLLLYYMDDSIKYAYEVENILSKPCIGKIPPFNNNDKNSNLPHLVVEEDPLSPEAEAFKKLRFNIEILNKKNPKIIAVTSIIENEGKTTVAINLALAYALAGFKTLVIDGDLRRPSHHKVFEISNEYGFCELITRGILKPIKTKLENLFILPAGSNPINVLKVLDAFDLEKIKGLLLESFDIILLDTPPLLPVAETETLINFAGQYLLVVRADYTSRRLLSEVTRSLPENLNLLGVVINFYQRTEGYYRYYKYYHHKDEENNITKFFKKIGQIIKEA